MMRIALLVVPLSIVACSSAAKRETASLTLALDRFRAASDAEKPAAAANLRAVLCTDKDVCDAKDACVPAVDKTSRALELKSEVEARLVDLEKKTLAPDDPVARALPLKLAEAESLLNEGRAAMGACESRVAAIRLKNGV